MAKEACWVGWIEAQTYSVTDIQDGGLFNPPPYINVRHFSFYESATLYIESTNQLKR